MSNIDSLPSCIIVSGLGHSGSRLVVDLLASHPEVSVPLDDLNEPREYPALHTYFINTVDRTKMHEAEYNFDKDELFFLLDSYLKNVDRSKPYTVIKFPFYLLWCFDALHEYFQGNVSLIYNYRDLDKIKASFYRRGENQFLFLKDQFELSRQIKKLSPKYRSRHLGKLDLPAYLEDLSTCTQEWRDRCAEKWPNIPIVNFDADIIASNPGEWGSILDIIGLSREGLEESIKIIDVKRLANSWTSKLSVRSALLILAKIRRKLFHK